MEQIIEYGICTESNYEMLAGQVNELIKQCWQPIGALAVSYYNDNQFFHQAMVKYELKKKNSLK